MPQVPQTFKTGKKPAVQRPKDLLFTAYKAAPQIVVPDVFGFGNAFSDWGMLGNDNYGDCVFAGADHETELLNWLAAGAPAGRPSPVQFLANNALDDYGTVTGFTPSDPNSDQGTDVGQALEFRRKTGVIDAQGRRHKIAAYVKLEPRNLDMLHEALYLFEAVGIGFEFPGSAMDQFNQGQPWSIVQGSQIDGGHYVPLIGKRPGLLDCVTWGQTQQMTEEFFTTYCDEAYAIVSLEGLNARTATNYGGYSWADLAADAKVVGVISNDPGPGPQPPAPQPSPTPQPVPAPTPLTPEQAAYFNWGFNSGWIARSRRG